MFAAIRRASSHHRKPDSLKILFRLARNPFLNLNFRFERANVRGRDGRPSYLRTPTAVFALERFDGGI
jgi:hypothetical protein